MKTLLTLLTCLFILSPNVVLGETVKIKDLVKRGGLYYEKFTDVPFSGKTTGKIQGTFNNGRKDGAWAAYHDNGHLRSKGSYKNGKKNGLWTNYYFDQTSLVQNGRIKSKGNYKNDKREGLWVHYHPFTEGEIRATGKYENGKEEGPWVHYHPIDGTIFKGGTGTYRNGNKVYD